MCRFYVRYFEASWRLEKFSSLFLLYKHLFPSSNDFMFRYGVQIQSIVLLTEKRDKEDPSVEAYVATL